MKHIHRFFSDESLSPGQTVSLSSDDSFHAARVLRLSAGDRLELAGGDGRAFEAAVTRVDGSVELLVGDEIPTAPGGTLALTVVQAMPRGKKMDLVVEKLSEIGVAALAPVYTDMSVARPKAGGGEKFERWRRIARSSAGQSKRGTVMAVAEPVPLGGWLESWDGPLVVLATEIEAAPLGEAAQELMVTPGRQVRDAGATSAEAFEPGEPPLALVVGPEAGFSEAEISMLREHGSGFASLGRQVLRTETAALVSAAIVMHRLGNLG